MGLARIDGRTGQRLWSLDLASPNAPAAPRCPAAYPGRAGGRSSVARRSSRVAPAFAPAPDLDADGTPDLVLVSPECSLLAVSGKTGAVLWSWHARHRGGTR